LGILYHLRKITLIRISSQRIPVKRNRVLALVIHYILRVGFFLFRFFSLNFLFRRKELPLKNIKKILVIRIDGLGDVVMSTPAFKGIREIFSNAHITLLTATWSKELVEVMPTFDELIYFDAPWIVKKQKGKLINLFKIVKKLRIEKFDLAIDLRGDFRNNILMYFCNRKNRIGFNITGCDFLLNHVVPIGENHHLVNASLSLINYLKPKNIKEYTLNLWTTKEDRDFIDHFLRENGINSNKVSNIIVIIHPGARWYGRRWKAERYAQIADSLIEKYDARVILGGSSSDFELIRDIASLMKHIPIEAAGKTSLRQFLALLEKSDLFIGLDSGPMHMATAMGTKVVALFGPARPEAVGPWGNGHIVITHQKDFACSPCAQTVCKRPYDSCMQAITVEEVWAAVQEQIGKIFYQRRFKKNL